MGVFYKIKCALARWMYGRNGMDQLNLALLWGYIGICLVGMILSAVTKWALLSLVLDVILWALFVLILFRTFSKNLSKRREENSRWLNWRWRLKSERQNARARHADKEHRYFTCKNCKTICRVPVGKGKIVITCPKCGAQIHART